MHPAAWTPIYITSSQPSSTVLVQIHVSYATFGTSDGQRRRLSSNTVVGSGVGRSRGVDVGAEKGLAENGDQAALGLLSTLSALVDEAVGGGGGDGSW